MKTTQLLITTLFFTILIHAGPLLYIGTYNDIGHISAFILSFIATLFICGNCVYFINRYHIRVFSDELHRVNRNLNRMAHLKNKMTGWQRSQWNKAGSPLDIESLIHFSELKKPKGN